MNDWRLTNQAKYLTGATLRYTRIEKSSADWDHEHCCFCWKKFMNDENATKDILHEGYATEDSNWICVTCFDDFRDEFKWQLSE